MSCYGENRLHIVVPCEPACLQGLLTLGHAWKDLNQTYVCAKYQPHLIILTPQFITVKFNDFKRFHFLDFNSMVIK